MENLNQGVTLSKASLRADISRQTGAKFRDLGKLPSELTQPRHWLTRDNPFGDDWKEVEHMLRDSPDLQAKTIFDVLSERHPDRYQAGQLRTLQRHIRRWHALQGNDCEYKVFFGQRHVPGEAMQVDFTHTGELLLTLAGVPFKPLLCHAVLPYSGWQWATPCQSESILSLQTGIQDAVYRLGKVTRWCQTDNSTGATYRVGEGSRAFHQAYTDFLDHVGMKARATAVGEKEQNGTIEAHNGAFKRFLRQRLLLRGSCDFDQEEAFTKWLHEQLERTNQGRRVRLAQEMTAMRPLNAVRLPDYREVVVPVSTYSTINVRRNIYSVPPRLQGHKVKVRIYEHRLEIRFADTLVHTMGRQLGTHRHAIDYRHVIWSLVRKPGAFARYRYREDLFLSDTFRAAYAALQAVTPGIGGDTEYLRLLHLAASTVHADVELAIGLLIEQSKLPTSAAVKDIVVPQLTPALPAMAVPNVNLAMYDQLLKGAL